MPPLFASVFVKISYVFCRRRNCLPKFLLLPQKHHQLVQNPWIIHNGTDIQHSDWIQGIPKPVTNRALCVSQAGMVSQPQTGQRRGDRGFRGLCAQEPAMSANAYGSRPYRNSQQWDLWPYQGGVTRWLEYYTCFCGAGCSLYGLWATFHTHIGVLAPSQGTLQWYQDQPSALRA